MSTVVSLGTGGQGWGSGADSTTTISAQSGDLIVVFGYNDGNSGSLITPDGYTTEHSYGPVTSVYTFLFYRIATGNSSDNFVVTRPVALSYGISYAVIRGWYGSAAGLEGTTNQVWTYNDPPSVTASWGGSTGTIWLIGIVLDNGSAISWPTDYSSNATSSSGGGYWNTTGLAWRTGVASATENVGTVSGGTGAIGYSATIAVRDAAVTSQFAAPTSDISAGNWLRSSDNTGTGLYTMIDEPTTYSDTDYVYVNSDSTMEVKFASVSDPATSTGHKVRYRIKGNGVATITVSLRQGTDTEIASWSHTTASTTTTSYEQTLTGGQADSITDYADLRLRFVTFTP
jgi:hypothetical protein